MKPEFTPKNVTQLLPNEVFVFGSNKAGAHSGSAAATAKTLFGAIEGQPEGLQGQSYAIPTYKCKLVEIKKAIDTFIHFVYNNQDKKFYITEIGCGNAGFTAKQIAPMFEDILWQNNVVLPRAFAIILLQQGIKKGLKNGSRPRYFTFPSDHHYSAYNQEFAFSIVDLEKNLVEIIDGPRFAGYVPRMVDYEGETYTVVGDQRQWSAKFEVYNIFKSETTNYLAPGAFFHFYDSNAVFVIPKNLEFYGHVPFPHCKIVSNSPRFSVENGLVIDKKLKRVIQCIDQEADNIIVPDGIKEIYIGAFFGCKLKSITLPESIRRLEYNAFWECYHLEEITLPEKLNYIGPYCFAYSFNLKKVTFKGTKVDMGEFPFHRCGGPEIITPPNSRIRY